MEQNYFSCFLTIKGTMKIVLELPQLTVLHNYKDICSISFCMRVYCCSFICKEMLNWNSRLICICKNISFHPLLVKYMTATPCDCKLQLPGSLSTFCQLFVRWSTDLWCGSEWNIHNSLMMRPSWLWWSSDSVVGFIELHQWKVVRITCNNVEADCINTLTLLDTVNSITEHICGKKNKSTIVSEKFENDTFHICFQHQVETSHSCAGTLTLTPRSVT